MIKSILVPTDFSECAGFALDAAVELSRRFNARLHLLHCLDLANEPDPPPALERLERLVPSRPGIPIEYHYVPLPLPESVAAYVQDNGIDLIVMGSYGASGKSEFFIGSNTQKVVRTVHCPVLVLKKPLPEISFDKVVFASSFNETERAPFLHFKDLVKHFIPEVHLVIVHTSSLFDPPYIVSQEAMNGFKELCRPLECKTHILRDFSVEKGIRSFASDIGAELIGISNHYRHPVKRMLVGSNVEALINHAEVPVLSIDYPKAGNHQNDS